MNAAFRVFTEIVMWANAVVALFSSFNDQYDRAAFYMAMAIFISIIVKS